MVPDQQLSATCEIAASLGIRPESPESMRFAYSSEFSGLGVRYNIDDATYESKGHDRWKRLVILPLSWSGLSLHDLEPATIQGSASSKRVYCIWTVPLAVACTAMVRIICAESRTSSLRWSLKDDLFALLSYNLYDTSYEGDYEEVEGNEIPLSESEFLEHETAGARIKTWEMRNGEEWIRENLIKFVSGIITDF